MVVDRRGAILCDVPLIQARHTGITSIQIPSTPIAPPMVWPKRDNPSNIRSPTMVPMRTPTVATVMGAQSVSSAGPDVDTIIARTIDRFGRLDCVFNNAGFKALAIQSST